MKKNKNKKSQGSGVNCQGFSLIELVFSMFFLGVIILGVVNLQSSNLAIINLRNNQIQANLIANEGLQIIKGIGYTNIDNLYANICKTGCAIRKNAGKYILNNSITKEEIPGTIFERRLKIEDQDLVSAYKVIVYVEWDDSTGEHREKVNGKTVNGHVEAKAIIF